ncbi:MAG: Rod binding domain-containing protein [Nitrospinales bacterium]|jgi:Rod binding domain-containing protein
MGPIQPAQIQKNLFSQMSEKNLERLRNQSGFGKMDAEKDIEKVSRDFESVFVNKLLSSMRKTIPKSGLLDSFATDMFQSMMDEEMSKEMAKNKGMGMGEMIYNDLSNVDRVRRGQAVQSTYTNIKTDPVASGIKLPDSAALGIELPNRTISGIKLKE